MAKFTPIQLQEENIEEQIINCDLMEADTTNGDTEDGSSTPDLKKKEWGSYTEFLLASLSYAVGLGNIWRFPYLVYRNGGGAFFVPYFVMLFFVGIPLFVLEFAFGQYMQSTPVKVWQVSPIFTGIGYAMCIMSGLVSIYYNMIIAWSMRYLITSLFYDIRWNTCDNPWNTNECRAHDTANCTKSFGTMLYNGTCLHRNCTFGFNQTNVIDAGLNPVSPLEGLVGANITCSIHDPEWHGYVIQNSKMPSDEYFHNEILNVSGGIEELIGLRLDLVFCLFICWMIVFACLYNGFKSMGKSSYFTALFPYLVLTILFIRCITLEGASKGIHFYMHPDWDTIKHVHVWSDAAMQIFFSLSPCWGGIITLAKGNSLRHNFIKDAFYISIGNCLTSIYAGFVIFSIIGFMAHQNSSEVKDVVTQGAGLAFVAYPEAVSKLPISKLWAVLFFTMLCTLGFGTQFTLIESVVGTVSETMYPNPNRSQKRRVLLLTVMFFFACGLIMCTSAGVYILQLMDDHCASFSALLIGLFELFAIVWVFGVNRFCRAAQKMLGSFPMCAIVWKVIWAAITPTILASLFISSVLKYQLPTYGHYTFPVWSAVFGWILSLTSVLAIPAVAIYKLLTFPHPTLGWIEKIQILCRPSTKWVPPRFGDDDDDDSSSDDVIQRNGAGSKMQKMKPHKKAHHLNIHINEPTHCESQIALKANEERDEDEEDSADDNVYLNGNSSHYVAPGFRHNSSRTSFDSDAGLNMFVNGNGRNGKSNGNNANGKKSSHK